MQMRAMVNAQEFTKAIVTARHAIMPRPVIVEHGMIRIAIANGKVAAACSNGYLFIQACVPASGTVINGAVLVDPITLSSIISACEGNVELICSGPQLEIYGSAGKAKLGTSDVENFYFPEHGLDGAHSDIPMWKWYALCRATTDATALPRDNTITIMSEYFSVYREVDRCVFVKTELTTKVGIVASMMKRALDAIATKEDSNVDVILLDKLVLIKSNMRDAEATLVYGEAVTIAPNRYLDPKPMASFPLDGKYLKALGIINGLPAELQSALITCLDGKLTIRSFGSVDTFTTTFDAAGLPDFSVLLQPSFVIKSAAEAGDVPQMEIVILTGNEPNMIRITGNGIISLFPLMRIKKGSEEE
jgi:hypothetical protein